MYSLGSPSGPSLFHRAGVRWNRKNAPNMRMPYFPDGHSARDIATNPFLSPGSLDVLPEIKNDPKTFADYPPTYVSVGGREILYDEILLTASRIQEHAAHERITVVSSSLTSAGDKEYAWVTVDEEPDMFHDFTASPVAKTEALRTFNRIAHWIAALPPGREYPV